MKEDKRHPNDKSLFTISRKECLEFYPQIIENSDVKWHGAELLATRQLYGEAIAMATIGIEELIKAIILVLDGNGFEFRRIDAVNLFFKDHKMRYYTASLMFIAYVFADEAFGELMKMVNQQGGPARLMKLIHNSEEFQKRGGIYVRRKLEQLKQDLPFFMEMDGNRQRGFYCDHKENFLSPSMISKVNYDETMIKLEMVRKFGKTFIEAISDGRADNPENLELLVRTFKEADVYKHLGEALHKTRATDLFERLQKALFFSLEENKTAEL